MRPGLWVTTASGQEKPLARFATDLLKQRQDCSVVPTIDEADAVLVVDDANLLLTDMTRIRRLSAGRPVYVHSEADWPLVTYPGTYPSLRRRGSPGARAVSWSYLSACRAASWYVDVEPDVRFSFLGRLQTHAVRHEVANLHTADNPCVDVSRAPSIFPDFDYARSYRDLLVRTQFVLCPRGFGSASIRIFEAMAVGRVPVIISDEWVPPPVADWSAFSIRVDESRVNMIPTLTSQAAARAKAMGQEARRVFMAHFSSETFFDRAIHHIARNRKHNVHLVDFIVQNDWSRQLRSYVSNALQALR